MTALHTLRAGELEATWAPGAGMVGTSLRHRGAELLGQRDGLAGYTGRGSTFGIPFLHPWANRVARAPGAEVPELKREQHGLPIHGLLTAARDWEVRDADERALRADLDFPARLLPAFNFPHRVELAVALAEDELSLATVVTATGDVAVPISFGFHPYFALPGVPREEWEIALPVRRRAVLDGRMLPTGETAEVAALDGPLGDRSFDDAFAELEPGAPWVLRGGGRRLEVSWDVEDFPVAQVYSPPGAPFLCYEPMTAPINALVTGDGLRWVSPGETFTATWRVRVA